MARVFDEIASGMWFPEGPVVMADGSLLVVEMGGGTLLRVAPDGGKMVVARLGGGPNGAAIGPDGKCYVCNNGGFNWIDHGGLRRAHGRADDYDGGSIQRVDLETGVFETLYAACDGEPLKGPNDLVFDADGGFWFTDHGKTWGRLADRGALFYARADGSLIREVAFPLLAPNGIGLSPDGGTLYATETETARLWAWPITGPGELAKEAWPSPHGGRFIGGLDGYQRFDSLAVEAGGNICVGNLVRGGIAIFSPDGGLVDFIDAPDPYITNICFGGRDMRTAYLTSSLHGRLLETEWDRPGLHLAFR